MIVNMEGETPQPWPPAHTGAHTRVNTNTRGGVGRKLWCMEARFRVQV